MIVELHGAQFKNKGAQLMLRTVVFELKNRVDDIEFVVGTKCGTQDQRDSLSLKQIIPVRPWMDSSYYRLLLSFQELISKEFSRRIFDHDKYVTLKDIDALIDLSGFAFTDHWGNAPIKNFASLCDTYQRQGKPIVMLPQALGPFRSNATQQAFRKVIENVDLLYVRDNKSAKFAKQIAENGDQIHIAPDMTLFYPPRDDEISALQPYCCIIPSTRMFDQGKADWGNKYRNMITLSVEESLQNGFQVYVVVHDIGDYPIAENIADRFKGQRKVSIYQNDDPVTLKKFIGKSTYVVGSRYHGILAAFSYGVPALCMGWSHKYIYLYQDFGLEEFLITPDTSKPELIQKITHVGSPQKYREIKDNILLKLEELSLLNQQMWDSVVQTITG